MFRIPLTVTVLAIAGCANTVAETREPITLDGRTYNSVVRTFERSDGSTYSVRSVSVGAQFVSCNPADILDCESAVVQARQRSFGL
ncbi:hypothetical protein [Sulfitobacter sp. S190]|uniref:hypothetical protein n=1 Tax=Sulfitobacter sp. S190 TaxID=2867022 RepID=UPI0021A54B2D|nr:hypothetical protein [Sulfitobacter sp. S190]UWR23188.1 hypothetical protein K3756_04115 [Sulfitobacter sp. S190]